MATLSYKAVNTSWNWTGTVAINYTAVYDPVLNQTTVTFTKSRHTYFGRSSRNSYGTTSITVTAADNPSSKATASLYLEGLTNGGAAFYLEGTPSPVSVVVQHSAESGVKSVIIAGSTTINAVMSTNEEAARAGSGSGSTTVTMATAYTLDIAAGEGATVDVERTASSVTATGAVADGAMLYAGDVLEITYSTEPEYEVSSATVNGSAITSGTSHTVSADVAVIITTELSGILHVGNKVGSVYIAKDGQWHRGVTCAAKGGTWHPGC